MPYKKWQRADEMIFVYHSQRDKMTALHSNPNDIIMTPAILGDTAPLMQLLSEQKQVSPW